MQRQKLRSPDLRYKGGTLRTFCCDAGEETVGSIIVDKDEFGGAIGLFDFAVILDVMYLNDAYGGSKAWQNTLEGAGDEAGRLNDEDSFAVTGKSVGKMKSLAHMSKS